MTWVVPFHGFCTNFTFTSLGIWVDMKIISETEMPVLQIIDDRSDLLSVLEFAWQAFEIFHYFWIMKIQISKKVAYRFGLINLNICRKLFKMWTPSCSGEKSQQSSVENLFTFSITGNASLVRFVYTLSVCPRSVKKKLINKSQFSSCLTLCQCPTRTSCDENDVIPHTILTIWFAFLCHPSDFLRHKVGPMDDHLLHSCFSNLTWVCDGHRYWTLWQKVNPQEYIHT